MAGIDSPGLTASPAIAEKVVKILENSGLKLEKNQDFNPKREPIIKIKDENFDGKIDAKDPEKKYNL